MPKNQNAIVGIGASRVRSLHILKLGLKRAISKSHDATGGIGASAVGAYIFLVLGEPSSSQSTFRVIKNEGMGGAEMLSFAVTCHWQPRSCTTPDRSINRSATSAMDCYRQPPSQYTEEVCGGVLIERSRVPKGNFLSYL
jgi:hypothetical protein